MSLVAGLITCKEAIAMKLRDEDEEIGAGSGDIEQSPEIPDGDGVTDKGWDG